MKNQKSLLFILLIPFLCIGGCFLFARSPYSLCFDPFSGHIPNIAQDYFIEEVINAAASNNIDRLLSVSKKDDVAEKLIDLVPKFGSSYRINFIDDLAGLYDYRLTFDNGFEMGLSIEGHWTECPDKEITNLEVFENIRLVYVDDYSD